MKFKAILFDMDGVLIDSFYAWYHLFNASLNHFGMNQISEEEFKQNVWGGSIERDVKYYFKKQSVSELASYYFSNFSKFTKHSKIFPDTTPVLSELSKKNIPIGLVTNTFRKEAELLLRRFGIRNYFKVVVAGDDVKHGKPEPEMMLKACLEFGVNPKETILVGDTKNDILSGRSAGCFVVGFKIEGDKTINSLREIIDYF